MAARRTKADRKWQRQHNSHLATEYPHVSKCVGCGRVVLAGNVIGLMTLYDTYLLSQLGEAEAIIRRLRTFHCHHPNFDQRTMSHIITQPAPRVGYIIREHRCATPAPLPGCLRDKQIHDLPDECPF